MVDKPKKLIKRKNLAIKLLLLASIFFYQTNFTLASPVQKTNQTINFEDIKQIQATESESAPAVKLETPQIDDSLTTLITELILKHPLLNEYKYKIEAQRAKKIYKSAPPDPRIGVEVRTNDYPLNFGSIGDLPNNFVGLSLSKEFTTPGKLKFKGNIEEFETIRLEEDLNLSELVLISSLKQSFYNLYFIDQSLRIYSKIKDLFLTVEGTVKSNYEVGKSSQYDLLRVQLEISKIIEQIEALKKDRKVYVAEINSLVYRPVLDGLSPDYDLGLTPIGHEEEEIIDFAKANYPKLLAQEAQISKSLEAVKLAKREYIPNVTVKTFYGFRNNDELGSLFGVGLETTLPIFFRRKESQKLKAARAIVKAEEANYEKMELDTLFQVEKLYTLISKNVVLAELLGTAIIPQASLAADSSISTYKVGKTDFPSVLDSIRDLLNFEIEYHMRVAEGLKNVSSLEPLIGQKLEDINQS